MKYLNIDIKKLLPKKETSALVIIKIIVVVVIIILLYSLGCVILKAYQVHFGSLNLFSYNQPELNTDNCNYPSPALRIWPPGYDFRSARTMDIYAYNMIPGETIWDSRLDFSYNTYIDLGGDPMLFNSYRNYVIASRVTQYSLGRYWIWRARDNEAPEEVFDTEKFFEDGAVIDDNQNSMNTPSEFAESKYSYKTGGCGIGTVWGEMPSTGNTSTHIRGLYPEQRQEDLYCNEYTAANYDEGKTQRGDAGGSPVDAAVGRGVCQPAQSTTRENLYYGEYMCNSNTLRGHRGQETLKYGYCDGPYNGWTRPYYYDTNGVYHPEQEGSLTDDYSLNLPNSGCYVRAVSADCDSNSPIKVDSTVSIPSVSIVSLEDSNQDAVGYADLRLQLTTPNDNDEIAARNISGKQEETYLCCLTMDDAKAADEALNYQFMSNKMIVLEGRKKQLERLNLSIGELTTKLDNLNAIKDKVMSVFNPFQHDFSNTGEISR